MRHVVAPLAEFRPGDRKIITVGGRSIGVFRVGDRFYGIRNRCPHQGGPLCQGRIAPWPVSNGPGEFSMESEATLSIRLFMRRAYLLAKCWTRGGISSRRSRSGGTAIGNTFSR